MKFNDNFETNLMEHGPGYAVGYAFGVMIALWYMGPNLIKTGWSVEEVSEFLKMELGDIEAAIELFGPNDEWASEALKRRIKWFELRGYGDSYSLDAIERMVELEYPRIKELIRDPKWN